MAHALILARKTATLPAGEWLRMAVVASCGLALIFAS